MKKLLIDCGCLSAVRSVPPTPRRNDRAAPGAHRDETGSPRQFDRAGPLDALNKRERAVFENGLKSWAADHGLPTERRKEAVARLVKAADEGAVSIHVSGLGLRRLPMEIGMLEKTLVLDAQDNELQRLPKEIGDLHSLRELGLQRNALSKLPPEIGRLSKLTYLNLDENKLERLPDEIEGLTNLRTLSANTNLLSQVPASMKKLSNLRSLSLQHNQLWQLPGGWDELFHRLRSLDLSHNRLTELPTTFASPAKKMVLNLAHNPDLATLPRKFGGFEYGSSFENHTLKNHTGKIAVNTENTGIRRSLVQEGRLRPGRDIGPSDRPIRASERAPAVGEYEPDLGSDYSVRDYIREHGQSAQVVGLERVGHPELAAQADGLGPQPAWTKPVDAWLDERAQNYADRFGAPLPPPPAPVPAQPYAANWGAWPHVDLPGLTAPAAPPRQFNFDMPAVPPNLDVHAIANLLMQLSAQPQAASAAHMGAGPSTLHAPGPSMPWMPLGGQASMPPMPSMSLGGQASMPPMPSMPLGGQASMPPMPSMPFAGQPPVPANAAAMSWAQFEQPLHNPPPWAQAVPQQTGTQAVPQQTGTQAVPQQASTDEPAREKWAPPAWAAPKPTADKAPRAAAMPAWLAPTPPAEPAKEPDPEISPDLPAPGMYEINAYPESGDYGSSYRWPSSAPTEPEAEPSGAVDVLERMMSMFKTDY